ncbi:MAG: EscU/YscU/HrcU family type III secretion system export apparatus switch protein [Gammaproteobacteria bacterium]|nr:EscU/YscU/HrcU family type III secretion system export apparatus switch protein [Gammaproteobacteria bacterium]
MSEEFDKSEEATPFKLREARKKGQVAKSIELNNWFMLFSFSVGIIALWSMIASGFERHLFDFFKMAGQISADQGSMVRLFEISSMELLSVFGGLIILLTVTAVLSNILQTKPLFSTHPIKPDFTKLNPAKGFKKLFNRKVLFELLKALLKTVMLFIVAYMIVYVFIDDFYKVSFSQKDTLTSNILFILLKIALVLLAMMVITLIMDWIFSTKDFARQMRMSKRDVKDEHKRHEGHPEVKSKRREIQKELLKKSASIKNIKDSDVIITNPTEFAIALKYNKNSMVAPKVIAKGKGKFAAKIRKKAAEFNKPILRRPPLARKLFRECDIDGFIPPDSFQEVAKVYQSLMKLGWGREHA